MSRLFRIEYDVYRADYEDVLSRNHTGGISLSTKEVSIEEKYSRAKELYEKYQKDVQVKLNLLDENRVRCSLSIDRIFTNESFLGQSDERTVGGVSARDGKILPRRFLSEIKRNESLLSLSRATIRCD